MVDLFTVTWVTDEPRLPVQCPPLYEQGGCLSWDDVHLTCVKNDPRKAPRDLERPLESAVWSRYQWMVGYNPRKSTILSGRRTML